MAFEAIKYTRKKHSKNSKRRTRRTTPPFFAGGGGVKSVSFANNDVSALETAIGKPMYDLVNKVLDKDVINQFAKGAKNADDATKIIIQYKFFTALKNKAEVDDETELNQIAHDLDLFDVKLVNDVALTTLFRNKKPANKIDLVNDILQILVFSIQHREATSLPLSIKNNSSNADAIWRFIQGMKPKTGGASDSKEDDSNTGSISTISSGVSDTKEDDNNTITSLISSERNKGSNKSSVEYEYSENGSNESNEPKKPKDPLKEQENELGALMWVKLLRVMDDRNDELVKSQKA